MSEAFISIQTISDLHRFYNYGGPKHPLITVIDLKNVTRPDKNFANYLYTIDLYMIIYKKFKGSLKYGRSTYDFQEGTLMFTAPNQVMSPSADTEIEEGWFLAFHPDFIYGSDLGRKIHKYSFFQYDSNEALHISEDEKILLDEVIVRIKKEYSQNIDQHTQGLILNQIEMVLNYSDRFYDRQFFTRNKTGNDITQRFESLLNDYFNDEELIEKGIPEVKYFAEKLNLSPNYLSDLLSKSTGKTTIEHIHLNVVEKAKHILLGTSKTVSEIAYELGFEHPSHFTKVFKAKAGISPLHFRKQFPGQN
ncbi:helix-turn-helix domain-containing protein [Chryseobacterium geocarposphaerae]|uniref:AraC family transcriptional regulator n=1 Tax=Chryseobacterium geocarposphaerae TaxID=1416776 RepID=A0A2M9C968_9FLAO|nr:helix-turn-helix domain-containing protein [Chryseobacterium geocarposphaerae]PJJ67393.1 AraC family transcriptional regulator [Chryseobacterium geocarposphaerae]